MERVYGGRIGSLWPVPERALAGAGFAGFGYRGCLRCRAALYRTASCAGYTDCAGISCLLPAGAGRQLPLYNYDSECFIFDTMAESRINTLPKPDVIISLKNNYYYKYKTECVCFYCAGLVYLCC